MGIISEAIDISELGQHRLVVIYGRSGSGKTELGSTFPKPMLYAGIGDNGSNTIADKKGVKAVKLKNLSEALSFFKEALTLAQKGKLKYKSVFVDTFSMVTNIWIKENSIDKKKKMTQQMYGDLKVDTEELIRLAHELAEYCWVILTCHEAGESYEGMEEEILPDIHPNTSRGARVYLEGMANYGIHTLLISKDVEVDGVVKTKTLYAAQIGPNPYYWTKLQKPKAVKVPQQVVNLSYKKLAQLLQFESASSNEAE